MNNWLYRFFYQYYERFLLFGRFFALLHFNIIISWCLKGWNCNIDIRSSPFLCLFLFVDFLSCWRRLAHLFRLLPFLFLLLIIYPHVVTSSSHLGLLIFIVFFFLSRKSENDFPLKLGRATEPLSIECALFLIRRKGVCLTQVIII